MSRRASRKLPRKPFEAAPRDLPDLPSEHATCFRVPSENPSSGSRPNLPSVPESLNSKLPPGALRAATRPGAHAMTLSGRLPGHPPSVFRMRQVSPSAPSGKSSRKPRMRCVPECRVRFPRMPPVAPRDHSDTARQPRESPPKDPPGHSANAPRVPANSRKSNKMF